MPLLFYFAVECSMTQILKNIEELKEFQKTLQGSTLGLVPTMGNLHDGHLSLMKIAQANADVTIASIFVNPTQFGENEDLAAYPRTFEEDLRKLKSIGVDAVFYPTEEVIYPHKKDNTISINMPHNLTHILCGLDRPTHFQGVATVVSKLFQLIRPHVAVFGEKDFQQLAIIRRLNEELFFGIKILSGNIVRERSGLAMSSRNQYLSDDDKQKALWLNKTLIKCRELLLAQQSVEDVLNVGKQQLINQGLQVEYLDFRDIDTLADKPTSLEKGILLVAARVGTTRLIDNLRIQLK